MKVLVRIRKRQAFRLVPAWDLWNDAYAFAEVSWTMSSASAAAGDAGRARSRSRAGRFTYRPGQDSPALWLSRAAGETPRQRGKVLTGKGRAEAVIPGGTVPGLRPGGAQEPARTRRAGR